MQAQNHDNRRSITGRLTMFYFAALVKSYPSQLNECNFLSFLLNNRTCIFHEIQENLFQEKRQPLQHHSKKTTSVLHDPCQHMTNNFVVGIVN